MGNWIKAVLLAGILGHFFVETTPGALAADAGRGKGCRRGDVLRIQDLNMTPDPVVQGGTRARVESAHPA